MTASCDFYRFCNRFTVAIAREGMPGRLESLFERHRSEPVEQPLLEIHFQDPAEDDPAPIREFNGRYKGIPWQVQLAQPQSCPQIPRVYFHSPLARDFLFIRVVLLPFLKRQITDQRGVTLLGSAFSTGAGTFVITGLPGCGKTRWMLDAVAHGATFLADNELCLNADGLCAIFNDLELRYATVRNSVFWESLESAEKAYLLAAHVLSLATGGALSLNLIKQPEDLGLPVPPPQKKEPVRFLFLQPGATFEQISRQEFLSFLLGYEKGYGRSFGEIFYQAPDVALAAQSWERLPVKCEFWKIAPDEPAGEVLNLARKAESR